MSKQISNVQSLCDTAVENISANEGGMGVAKNRYAAGKVDCYVDVVMYINSVQWRKKV